MADEESPRQGSSTTVPLPQAPRASSVRETNSEYGSSRLQSEISIVTKDAVVTEVSPEGREDFLWKVHSYTSDYIRFADSKAAIVLGVAGGILGAVLTKERAALLLGAHAWGLLEWAALGAIVLLGLTDIAAALVVSPRLSHAQPRGFLYWGSIREYGEFSEFWKGLGALSRAEQERHLAEHLYALAGIAKSKYRWLSYAMWMGIPGSLLGALVLAL